MFFNIWEPNKPPPLTEDLLTVAGARGREVSCL